MPASVEELMRDQVTPQMSRMIYGKRWVIDAVTPHGIDIRYGDARDLVTVPWELMERVPTVLADQGWVPVLPSQGSPSFASLTRNELPVDSLPAVAGLLSMGRIIDLQEGPPMIVRLSPGFGEEAPRFPSDVTRAGQAPEVGMDRE